MTVVEREIATYGFGRVDRLVRREWGFFPETLERWRAEGWNGDPVAPAFKAGVIGGDADFILMRTSAGAVERFPRARPRHTEVMPEYVRHPVESREDWRDAIKPRLDPDTPERWDGFRANGARVSEQVRTGRALYRAMAMGGYMYLRALMGPEGVLLSLYDSPDLVHEMMQTWLTLMKTCLLRVQKRVPFFRLLMGEDICYKSGPLISPAMMREFLFPYYAELIEALRAGQREPMRFEVDSDGNVDALIPLYGEVGFDAFTPFEAAAGSDVVRLGRAHPGLVMSGGIDKRILARGKDEIRAEVQRVIPPMLRRGGYIPTVDHSVPSGVPFANYLHYRQLVTSMDGEAQGSLPPCAPP